MRGFIVEGPSDEKVIKQICKKLGIRPEVRLMRGNNLGKQGDSVTSYIFEGAKR